MTYLYPNSKVAAGVSNTGGLVAWESIVVSGVPFFAPVIYGNYDPGAEKDRQNGQLFFSGWPTAKIIWGVITQDQWYYLQTTFCSGGYSGAITIKYRQENPNAYVTANSILRLAKLADSKKQSRAISNYTALLTRLVVF